MNWANAYIDVLVNKLGFLKGASSPCSFFHKGRGILVAVHGDDFVSEGCKKDLLWMDAQMKKHFELKTEILGPNAKDGDVGEVRLLNRILRWEDRGISWEPDPRHAELIVQQLELQGAKAVVSPGSKDEEKKINLAETRRDEKSEEEGVYHMSECDDGNVASWELHNAKAIDIEEVMVADGWHRKENGNWLKDVRGAVTVGRSPIGVMKRRITRDLDNGNCMEDMWVDSLTPAKIIDKALVKPRNVSIEVQLDDVMECGDQSWLDGPMTPKEQSLYRAITARVNFLAMDRADLQFASKECSRHMSSPKNGD